jgi:hypothetical protein
MSEENVEAFTELHLDEILAIGRIRPRGMAARGAR